MVITIQKSKRKTTYKTIYKTSIFLIILPTKPFTYHLPTYLLIYLPTYLPTHPHMTHLLTYLLNHQPIYLLAHSLTDWPYHNPNLGFATKAKTWKDVNQECNSGVTFAFLEMQGNVWGNEPTHSQVDFYFESWSPYRVPNFQIMISGVKIHWIKNILIPLKSSWDVYV
jgi:hypothetical protein